MKMFKYRFLFIKNITFLPLQNKQTSKCWCFTLNITINQKKFTVFKVSINFKLGKFIGN